MGRPKTYQRDDVTRKAMDLFWTQGFEATSTKDLAGEMGINSYSLFAEFESKQGLYEAALDLYRRDVVTKVFGALLQPDAGLETVLELLDLFAARAGASNATRGCFACNVATERAASDSVSHDYFATHIEYINKAICNALRNAKAKGQLQAKVSCEKQSKLLVATLLGFSVLMRAGTDAMFIVSAVREARAGLEALRV